MRGLCAVLVMFIACGPSSDVSPGAISSPAPFSPSPREDSVGSERSRIDRPKTIQVGNLPQQGFVVGSDSRVLLVNLKGQVLKVLPNFTLAGNPGAPGVWLESERGFFRLNSSSSSLVPVARRKAQSRMYEEGPEPKLAAPPGTRIKNAGIVGHWRYAFPRQDGAVLAQWSGECEVPTAYWIAHGGVLIVTGEAKLRHAPESIALGWSVSGEAIVQVGEGACGIRGNPPGIYSFSEPGNGRLIFKTPRFARAEMWR